jgi:hypothetical protein
VVAGTIVLLGVLPGIAFGPKGAVRETERFLKFVAAPGLFSPDVFTADDQALVKALAEELHDMTAKQSQSFMAVLHYMRYPQGGPRPQKPDADVKTIHFAISGLMVLACWGAAESAKRKSNLLPSQWLVILGNFSTAMLLIVPMSHMHYYCMMLPHVAGLYLYGMATHPHRVTGNPRIMRILIAWGVLNAVPLLPGCTILNDYGFATFTTLALWIYSVALTASFSQSPSTSGDPYSLDSK